jgi:predicted DNA-binding transcriptional regulator YafY
MAKKTTRPKQRSDADRRVRQADAVARKLKLLGILAGRGLWSKKDLAKTLAERCGASEPFTTKTIERDMLVLSLAGVVIEEHGVNPKQYRVRPDQQFPVLNLTQDEILGQATATVITSAAGLNVAAGAKATSAKLAASREEVEDLIRDATGVMEVLGLKLADHSGHADILKAIQLALIENRQLGGDYASPYKTKPVKLTLHPIRLCLVNQAWYLIAMSADNEQPKTYRVQRFKTLKRLDVVSLVPADFSVRDYFGNAWGVYRGQKSYDVEIQFNSEAAPLVCETTWHATQQVVGRGKDGSVTLTFKVDGLDEILWWVLGWSGRARVIKPTELRTMVVEQLQAGLELNEGK